MGLDTNSRYLHGIQPDKRIQAELSDAEKAFDGLRISVTFRNIGTFITSDSKKIWGQGATSKRMEGATLTINGDACASEELIKAFGTENQSTSFDWHKTYGKGFDVLHLKTPLPELDKPILFLRGNHSTDDQAVTLYLKHLGMETDIVEEPRIGLDLDSPKQLATMIDAQSTQVPWTIRQKTRRLAYRDVDALHSQVTGVAPILLYLYMRYKEASDTSQMAKEIEILNSPLLYRVKEHLRLVVKENETLDELLVQEVDELIADCMLLSKLGTGDKPAFAAGPAFGLADCYLFPIVERLAEHKKQKGEEVSTSMKGYLDDVRPMIELLRGQKED